MDNPALRREELSAVFRDLNYTNLILGGQKITVKAFRKMIADLPKPNYTIVDMGCGDGDMLRRLSSLCRRMGVQARFIGVDNSAMALAIAASRSVNYPEISYTQASLLDLKNKIPTCDIVLCTLTLHHFRNNEIPGLLQTFCKLAALGVIINDLQRNPLAYYLFVAFSLIFIKTKIAKEDGLISIRRGFLRRELHQFSRTLTTCNHRIQWCWVFRYLWIMQIKGEPSNE